MAVTRVQSGAIPIYESLNKEKIGILGMTLVCFFFFQAEDGIRDRDG